MSLKSCFNCLKFSLTLCFLLVLQPSYTQYNFTAVDDLITANKKLFDNDLVVLIYKDGKVVYKNETNKEFTLKTQAPIASCSKWLTAALVMTFVDEGKISLDDKVSNYLPVFSKYSKGYITIRQCLSHTTGIEADNNALKNILQRRKFANLEEEVNAFASKRAIEKNPGELFHYSNVGLNIAARVCEVVSKKTFDRLITERILRPLKMRGTTFTIDYDAAPNPSGGAKSTAGDYLNFLTMILNKGTFETKRILSEAAVAEMQKVQTGNAAIGYTPKVADGFSYGLGEWIIETSSAGTASAVSSPGLFGTWPVVDNCRGYACIFFVKSILSEQRKDFYVQLKEAIDEQIKSTCN